MGIEIKGVTTLLEVFDMPTSVAFYRELLGFEVVSTSEQGDEFDWCLLRHGETELMLNTLHERDERPPEPDPTRASAHGDTWLFFACDDLDAAYAHLRVRGVAVEPPVVRDYGMTQLTLTDPDGYHLCLQRPFA